VCIQLRLRDFDINALCTHPDGQSWSAKLCDAEFKSSHMGVVAPPVPQVIYRLAIDNAMAIYGKKKSTFRIINDILV
jgi:hypothetical protein